MTFYIIAGLSNKLDVAKDLVSNRKEVYVDSFILYNQLSSMFPNCKFIKFHKQEIQALSWSDDNDSIVIVAEYDYAYEVESTVVSNKVFELT